MVGPDLPPGTLPPPPSLTTPSLPPTPTTSHPSAASGVSTVADTGVPVPGGPPPPGMHPPGSTSVTREVHDASHAGHTTTERQRTATASRFGRFMDKLKELPWGKIGCVALIVIGVAIMFEPSGIGLVVGLLLIAAGATGLAIIYRGEQVKTAKANRERQAAEAERQAQAQHQAQAQQQAELLRRLGGSGDPSGHLPGGPGSPPPPPGSSGPPSHGGPVHPRTSPSSSDPRDPLTARMGTHRRAPPDPRLPGTSSSTHRATPFLPPPSPPHTDLDSDETMHPPPTYPASDPTGLHPPSSDLSRAAELNADSPDLPSHLQMSVLPNVATTVASTPDRSAAARMSSWVAGSIASVPPHQQHS